MFKRNLSILIAAAGMALSLCACAGGKAATTDKKNVVVTTSFLQDMVEELAGDTVNVELIIPALQSLRTIQSLASRILLYIMDFILKGKWWKHLKLRVRL